jgi:zinc and cadmium transporter
MVWVYALSGVAIVSLISLIGAFTISMDMLRLRRALRYLIAFAAGALLGDAFLHLLPEAIQDGNAAQVSFRILTGLVVFLFLERVVYWRHSHLPTHEHAPHPVGITNLVGDALHNFLDGVIIGGSFLVSVPLGISTTLAVILHEIPQEIGDFSVLIHAGYGRRRALWLNFLSAVVAILGTTTTLILGSSIENISAYLVPLTIGGFLYIATVDLLPEVHREERASASAVQLLYFLAGIGVMAALLLLE